jgi:integration host factor subunit alpha
VNKSEFLACLLDRLPYNKEEASFIIEIIEDILKDGLIEDGQVRTPFGTFSLKTRKSRVIRDISTGEKRTLPERQDIVFKPSNKLKEKVNGEERTET